jgi:hypothetical protein
MKIGATCHRGGTGVRPVMAVRVRIALADPPGATVNRNPVELLSTCHASPRSDRIRQRESSLCSRKNP